MLNTFYKNFKSGTDIRGVAVEGVKGQDINLTDEVISAMANKRSENFGYCFTNA